MVEMGESHGFLMLGTLTPDSKSLGQALYFPFIPSCLRSRPLLLICTWVFSTIQGTTSAIPKGTPAQ